MSGTQPSDLLKEAFEIIWEGFKAGECDPDIYEWLHAYAEEHGPWEDFHLLDEGLDEEEGCIPLEDDLQEVEELEL